MFAWCNISKQFSTKRKSGTKNMLKTRKLSTFSKPSSMGSRRTLSDRLPIIVGGLNGKQISHNVERKRSYVLNCGSYQSKVQAQTPKTRQRRLTVYQLAAGGKKQVK